MASKKRYATHLTQPDGSRLYISAGTKEEFEKKLTEVKMLIGAGVDIADQTLFQDYARLWMRAYKRGKIRESSYVTLSINMEKHVIPYFNNVRVKDVKPMHIQMFMGSLSGLSKSVQSKCLQTVKAIFRSAVDNGLILKSPVTEDVKAGGEAPEEEEALTNEQSVKLLQAVYGTRAYLFVLLLLTTGMRRGEAIGLMWEDIDFHANVIHVRHNKAFLGNANDAPVTELLKTDASKRDLPIPPILWDALAAAQEESSAPFVFSTPQGKSLTKASFRSMWEIVDARTVGEKKALGDPVGGGTGAKVTLDFSCHPHQLRHTYITQLFEHGCDIKEVQYLAGHSTPEMTMRVYTHYRRKCREAETKARVAQAMNYLNTAGCARLQAAD